jgi:hypothetical protein
MTERRESEEISRAAQRMAEAAEEMSRSVARLAEHEAATEQAYRFWENLVRTLEEVSSTGSWGRWRIVPFQPTLSEEDAVLLALQSVREVREDFFLLQMDDFFTEGLCLDDCKEGKGERRVGAPPLCEGQNEGPEPCSLGVPTP